MSDSLRQHLVEEGTRGHRGQRRRSHHLFDGGAHHLVICDVQLPDMDGLTLLRHMKDAKPKHRSNRRHRLRFSANRGRSHQSRRVLFRRKAFDFEELLPLAEKALERRQLMAETENMRDSFRLAPSTQHHRPSKQMQTIYETIESVAKSDANVLIVGESGTGKELIANAIHYNSLRAKKPFIKVNCAALPKRADRIGTVWSHERRLTGAHADKEGLVQHAAGGSLMLDEIAEMPVSCNQNYCACCRSAPVARLVQRKLIPSISA